MDTQQRQTLRDKARGMVSFHNVQSLPGIINFVQMLLGFAALFASSFIWVETNVYIQFIYAGYGWQTLIVFILFVNWIFNITVFVSGLFDRPLLEGWPKLRKLICFAILLSGLIISAGFESWYVSLASNHVIFHARFVAVTIFNWLLVVSYIGLIVVTVLFE